MKIDVRLLTDNGEEVGRGFAVHDLSIFVAESVYDKLFNDLVHRYDP